MYVDTSQLVTSADFNATQRSLLMNTLLPTAVSTLSSLLQVDPVVGNLVLNRDCSVGYYSNGVCAGFSTSAPTCVALTVPTAYLNSSNYYNCINANNVGVLFTTVSGCVPPCSFRGC